MATFRSIYDFHEWLFETHCEFFFPLEDHMSPHELDYLVRCARLAGRHEVEELPGDQPDLSYFSYSHRVIGDRVNSSRIAYGSVGAPELAFEAAEPVLGERGIDVASLVPAREAGLAFYGLGWDFETDGFKIYYRAPELERLKAVRPELFDSAPRRYLREGLWACQLQANQLVEEKLYFYPVDEPDGDPLAEGSLGRAVVTSDRRATFSQYDVEDPELWYRRVNRAAQSIIESYLELECTLDTIAFQDRDHCTLYFPRATIDLDDGEDR